MKKVFAMIAVASLFMVACNNDAEKTPTTDSPTPPAADTMTPPPPPKDTTKTIVGDTAKKTDTLKK